MSRALSRGVVVAAVALLFIATWFVLGVLSPGHDLLARSPGALMLVNLALLLLIAPIHERVQRAIDRGFLRSRYETEQALADLSRHLASARTIEKVASHTRHVLGETIHPTHVSLLLREEGGRLRPTGQPDGRAIALYEALATRLEAGEVCLRSEHDGGDSARAHSSWAGLDAEVLVPACMAGSLVGALALGPKKSGRPYGARDLPFLRTAANQIALAVTNAAAFDQLAELNRHLEDLNGNLEAQVEERTSALYETNAELNCSLEKLRAAYVQLERSHASLLRADRLASLGRLTAGLAHEMNTPLSAVLNSLKIIGDLGDEYASSVDDAEVLAEDHREIATEIITNTRAAIEWVNKAAAYIRSVKSHGRESRSAGAQRFRIGDVVADAHDLVAHRLRAASCRVEFEEAPAGIALVGDAGRFGQVLVNLITNAIDAYEERGVTDGCIEIRAARAGATTAVRVRDWAGGIPSSVLPHIFDELYTTKGPGRGTGLGLWIARNLVEEEFGGSLDVLTNGVGSCFTAEFSSPGDEDEPAPAPPSGSGPPDRPVSAGPPDRAPRARQDDAWA
jgi:signal transduction histidine kinase